MCNITALPALIAGWRSMPITFYCHLAGHGVVCGFSRLQDVEK